MPSAYSNGEPIFIRQSCEPRTDEQKREWVAACNEEARKLGVTFSRASWHPDNPDLLLFEGWKERPDDQGPLRFKFNENG
jgi:hypothetical protein